MELKFLSNWKHNAAAVATQNISSTKESNEQTSYYGNRNIIERRNDNASRNITSNNPPQDTTNVIVLGNSAERRELEELLLKLDLMEQECIQEKLNEEKEALKDEFVVLKRTMYKTLMETKDLIRTRYHIQLKKGNSVEVIQKGAIINKKLEELDGLFLKMKDVFKKQIKQRGKKFSDEQLDQRFKEMELLHQQIEESRSLFKNVTVYSQDDIITLTDFRSQMKSQGVVVGTAQEWRDPNTEEQSVIERWRHRDQDIDRQVEEIGDAIDRLGSIAIQIGEKADKQSQLVASLHRQVSGANEELVKVDRQIKEVLKKQGGSNFLCKLIMALLLIGLIAYIISGINRRILG